MRLDHAKLKKLLGSPAGTLVMGLVLAVVLMLLPAPWTAAIQGHVAALLRPGQVGVLSLREHGSRIVRRARSHFDTARKLAEAAQERDRLAEENRRLAAELAARQSQRSCREQDSNEGDSRRLLSARWVKASSLGPFSAGSNSWTWDPSRAYRRTPS